MFGFFERLINPYPPEHPAEPPRGLYQFCRHYLRGIEPHLAVLATFDHFIGDQRSHAL